MKLDFQQDNEQSLHQVLPTCRSASQLCLYVFFLSFLSSIQARGSALAPFIQEIIILRLQVRTLFSDAFYLIRGEIQRTRDYKIKFFYFLWGPAVQP